MPLCDSLHDKLNQFRLDGSYCDVTIRVERKSFQCHRVVLASASNYFKCLFGGSFKESRSSEDDITLPDIFDAFSFNIILEFIYLGRKPSCNEYNVYELLRSSDFLQLQPLKNSCVEYVLKHASSFPLVRVFKIFHLACDINDHLLMETLSKYYVVNSLNDFMQKDSFLEMAYKSLNLVLQHYRSSSVNFDSENFLLKAVIQWVFVNFEKRQKFFQNLINSINFGKITKDCVELVLKEYKTNYCEMNPKSDDENSAAALKMLVLDAFSLKKFATDDSTMFDSCQDPPMEIASSSIYIYTRDIDINKSDKDTNIYKYTAFSLNDFYDSRDSSKINPFQLNCCLIVDWNISCSFSMPADTFVLVSSEKSNHIYCLLNNNTEKAFRVYNSLDLSSDQYTELSSPAAYFSTSCTSTDLIETCGTDDGDIYFCEKLYSKIHRYNCNLDKWFPICDPETNVVNFSCVSLNNLLYVFEGRRILDEYVLAYDSRTPRWFELLSSSKTKSSRYYASSSNEYRLTSCVADGKIYVYNDKKFRVFEPVAGKWMDIELKGAKDGLWHGSDDRKLKLIPCGKQLFVFGSNIQGNYLTLNLTTNLIKYSKVKYGSVGTLDLVDVIVSMVE